MENVTESGLNPLFSLFLKRDNLFMSQVQTRTPRLWYFGDWVLWINWSPEIQNLRLPSSELQYITQTEALDNGENGNYILETLPKGLQGVFR